MFVQEINNALGGWTTTWKGYLKCCYCVAVLQCMDLTSLIKFESVSILKFMVSLLQK